MNIVIKKTKESSHQQLVEALSHFIELLETQDEQEAIVSLQQALDLLRQSKPGDVAHRQALDMISDAFNGELELASYILERPDPEKWTLTEQLSDAATRVCQLVRRLNS